MAEFTNEKTLILEVYLLNNINAIRALERYMDLYPERTPPHRTYFADLVRNLRADRLKALSKTKCSYDQPGK